MCISHSCMAVVVYFSWVIVNWCFCQTNLSCIQYLELRVCSPSVCLHDVISLLKFTCHVTVHTFSQDTFFTCLCVMRITDWLLTGTQSACSITAPQLQAPQKSPAGVMRPIKVTLSLFFLPLSSTFFYFLFVSSSSLFLSHLHVFILSPPFFSYYPTVLPPPFYICPRPPHTCTTPLWVHAFVFAVGIFCLCVSVCVCVCMVWVLLKPCCCLRPRQCPASAAQWGWTGSLWPHRPACPSPPTTSPTARRCRTTTLKAATTCCHTVTWRGGQHPVFRVKLSTANEFVPALSCS